MAISRRPSMNAVAVKKRGGRRPSARPAISGSSVISASTLARLRGAHVGGRVEREGRHVETEAVRPAHVVGAHRPLGRDEVVVLSAAAWRKSLVDRLERQQAGGHPRHALARDVEVGGDEALDQQLRARDAAGEDRVHHAVRVGGRGVEVRVARHVLDLEVDLGAGEPRELEQPRRSWRSPRAVAAPRVGSGLPGLPSTSVRQARKLGERERAQLAGAVRGAVERGVVERNRNAVLAELRVHLEHEPVARSVPVGGEALLRIAAPCRSRRCHRGGREWPAWRRKPAARRRGAGPGRGRAGRRARAHDSVAVCPSLATAQYAAPVDGLYLCGGGTHPGGGVMGAWRPQLRRSAC